MLNIESHQSFVEVEVHLKSTPVCAPVYNWVNECKPGRTFAKDESSSERPVEVITPKMIDRSHNMVLNDRRI